MKKIFAIMLFTMLLVTACATETTTTQEITQGEKVATPSTVTKSVDTSDFNEVLEKVKSETMAKNSIADQTVLPFPFKQGKIGETLIYGVIFNQVDNTEKTYVAKVAFVEGRDTSSNRIEADANTVMRWAKTAKTDYFTLDTKETQYLPLTFVIGDEIKPGVKTVSGAYQFDIDFYEIKGSFENKIDKATKKLYLRVE